MEPREFLIDMAAPAEERWQDVIVSCRRNALKLARWVLSTLDRMPLSHVVRGAIAASHRRSNCLFDDDLSAWAAGLGMPHRDLMAVNAAHELAQFNEVKLSCTSVVMRTERFGMIHGRNLDWEMQGLGESTVVYHFVGCPLEFMAVSLPGLVGVLSGMGPGRFSVTLNRATPNGRPTLDWDPQILVRHVLQTAIDYDHAVRALSEAPLRTPAIFTVASAGDERACVVERTRKGHAIREFTGVPLVAANHFQSPALAPFNTTPALIDLSQAQVRNARRAAERVEIVELGDLFEVLNGDGIVTDRTCQQVALSPTEGYYCAVGRAT
jgi:hypothetical protein